MSQPIKVLVVDDSAFARKVVRECLSASGMDVVDAIGQVPVGDNGPMPGQAPVTPILVKKVSLLK